MTYLDKKEYMAQMRDLYHNQIVPALQKAEQLTNDYRKGEQTLIPEDMLYNTIVEELQHRVTLSSAYIWDRLCGNDKFPKKNWRDKTQMERAKKYLKFPKEAI